MFWGADINFNLKLKGLSVLMEGSGESFMCSLSLCVSGMCPALERGLSADEFYMKQTEEEAQAARGGG